MLDSITRSDTHPIILILIMKFGFLLLTIPFVQVASASSIESSANDADGRLLGHHNLAKQLRGAQQLLLLGLEDGEEDTQAKSYCWSYPDYKCYGEQGYPACCFADGKLPWYGGASCPSEKPGCVPNVE